MAGPVGGRGLVLAAADDHVQLLLQHHPHHRRRGVRLVGRIAVDEQIEVGVDVGEHAAHHMAFSRVGLVADDGPGLGRDGGGGVGRAVVEDVDDGVGQGFAEVEHHLGDGAGLVQAGDQYGDPRRLGGSPGRDPLGDLHGSCVHVLA